MLFLSSTNFYYLSLHFKLSSVFFTTQLLDMFSYQLSTNTLTKSVVMYYFFNAVFNKKIYVASILTNTRAINSIAELYNNANWLERECGELSNIYFIYKKDNRNLMLPYGESSFPFNKSYPSIGYHELYYNQLNDNIISSEVSIQY